ncbi:MAG: type II toxin-antitoxin system RelE/ParE family toxin [Rhodocyclaceae bacterium]|nr:type II toxin-antitoxin system RelE/ParE family toxin [Rhodocyclaceae bacterium]
MSLGLIVQPEAELDIKDAHAWYEARSPGLGAQFLDAIDEALLLVSREPKIFQRVHRSVRRALIHRFPYGIFYTIEPNRIVVFAVMHTARHPAKWKQRSKG